jgi:hypothetical protein
MRFHDEFGNRQLQAEGQLRLSNIIWDYDREIA